MGWEGVNFCVIGVSDAKGVWEMSASPLCRYLFEKKGLGLWVSVFFLL